MGKAARLWAGSVAFALLTGACGGHFVVRGSSLYEEGRYIEAAEVFEKTEARLRQSSNADRARFGLYRGATFLKLGDVPRAALWLGYSRSIWKLDPESLDASEAALLDSSLAAVGRVDAAPAPQDRSELATAPIHVTGDPAVTR